jgi:hypothetical protein
MRYPAALFGPVCRQTSEIIVQANVSSHYIDGLLDHYVNTLLGPLRRQISRIIM